LNQIRKLLAGEKMDGTRKYASKISKSEEDKYCISLSYAESRSKKKKG
jgi:hypothetical protein